MRLRCGFQRGVIKMTSTFAQTTHAITSAQMYSVMDTIGYFLSQFVTRMDAAIIISSPQLSVLDFEIACVIAFELWMFMEDMM